MAPPVIAAYVSAVLAAYLLGAVPFGFALVQVLKGIDIRTIGSGSIGATNVARAAGAKIGGLAFILDVAKGFAASTLLPYAAGIIAGAVSAPGGVGEFLRGMVTGEGFDDLRMLCGLAAIAGHVWTIFLRFKGGKGVATSLGVLLGLAPQPTLVALGVWVAVTRVSGYVSLGSIVAAVVLPVAYALINLGALADGWRLLVFIIVVGALVIVRHRGNIKRLLAGTENRFNFRSRRVE